MTSNLSTGTPEADAAGFHARQAIDFSRPWIDDYDAQHGYQSAEDRGLIAGARLDFLFVAARAGLSGFFSTAEFFKLMDCFAGEMLEPAAIDAMPEAVPKNNPEAIALSWKLSALDRLQKVALADLLEQAHYRSSGNGFRALAIAEQLGVVVK